MSFRKFLKETLWLLLAERQISYQRLALEFELDATLEGLCHELIQVKREATDHDGDFLVATSTATSSALAKLEPLTPVRENRPVIRKELDMKRTVLAATLILAGTAPAAAQHAVPQRNNDWYVAGQNILQERLAHRLNTNRARNIILMISDGMGVGTNYATRLFEGQQQGKLGEEHVLSYERFPHLALVKTYNTNAQTPDSAGTATAMHAGVKTRTGVIGVDASLDRGNCEQVEAARVNSIADILAGAGKSVGVVTTARITHATPAAVYAYVADRNYENDTRLPAGCTVPDIAVQLIEKMRSGVVDLALGGGRSNFLPLENIGDKARPGRRGDGRNLIEEAKSFGARYVWNDVSADKLDFGKAGPILGLFQPSHMKYEHDRKGEPSLSRMTEIAIEALQQNEHGFFLHIEAGRVDHANHSGNLHRVLTDGIAFANAVTKAVEMTDPNNTLIIVTADHGHAIAFNGYCGRGTPINGLCYQINAKGRKYHPVPVLGKDGKPMTVAGYLNGASSILRDDLNWLGLRQDLTQEQVTDPDYKLQALVPMSSETHSGEDVAVYARGPWSHLFDGTIEQNYIFHVMLHAANAPQ